MARPRVPRLYGIVQFIARLLSLGSIVGVLAILIRLNIKYGKTYGAAYATAIVALIIDGSEALALADTSRRIRRILLPCAVTTDIIVLALACGSILEIVFSDWGLGDDPNPPVNGYPWMDSEDVALWYMVAVTAWRFVLCIWGCVDCCCIFRDKPKRPIDRDQGADVALETMKT
ncbi:hypothetical protein N431DRAFT_554061 [Stipitochalara longipes BDJ]|nr:hypothetical protein N431DRAFT_554061 [Stipitochalara longipes BDJ]